MNYIFTLDSVFKSVPPKTQNRLDKPVYFPHANILLSYVSETIFAWKPEFPLFMSIILWPGTIYLVPMLSQNACCM